MKILDLKHSDGLIFKTANKINIEMMQGCGGFNPS